MGKLKSFVLTGLPLSSENFHVLQRLVQLPSVRDATVVRMKAAFKNTDIMQPAVQTCNLVSLTLRDCVIGDKPMHSMLSTMRQLKHFDSILSKNEDYNRPDPYYIVAGLELACRQTLESFKLLGYHRPPRGYGQDYYYMGSLSSFPVLGVIETSIDTLFLSGSNIEEGNLGTALPSSSRDVTLHLDRNTFDAQFKSVSGKMLRSAREDLRRLSSLKYLTLVDITKEFSTRLQGPGSLTTMMLERGGVFRMYRLRKL